MAVTAQIMGPMPNHYDDFIQGMHNAAALRLLNAQAQKEQAQASMPFGGMILRGPAGQAQSLEILRQRYGENSPQYQTALGLFKRDQDRVNAEIAYRNMLTNTGSHRALSGFGKTQEEANAAASGRSPFGVQQSQPSSSGPMFNVQTTNAELYRDPQTGQVLGDVHGTGVPALPISDQQKNKVQNLVRNAGIPQGLVVGDNNEGAPSLSPEQAQTAKNYKELLDKTAHTKTQNDKRDYSTNVEKTFAMMHPELMAKYSGIPGALRWNLAHAKAALGISSPELDDIARYNSQAQTLASQIRQFYGDSITPTQREHYMNEIMPFGGFLGSRGIFQTPSSFKSGFNAVRDILNKEGQTYSDHFGVPSQTNGNTASYSPPQQYARPPMQINISKSSESTSNSKPKRRRYNPQTGEFE